MSVLPAPAAPTRPAPAPTPVADLRATLAELERPVYAYARPGGGVRLSHEREAEPLAWAPALPVDRLGDASFLSAHGVSRPYVAGALAGGISGEEMVMAMARAGMLAFFGSGGLALPRVEVAIATLQARLPPGAPYGFNLLHAPFHEEREMALVELYLRRRVHRVSASAFTQITAPLVYYRVRGIRRGEDGRVACTSSIFAKVSRPEVARQFLEPPPPRLLAQLVEQGRISAEEAELAEEIPMAEDITAEGDSGGHTDNRPGILLLSALSQLRDEVVGSRAYPRPVRVGAAGGIGTPAAAAAAFLAGAAYVLTGSVNQACREAATSEAVKAALCEVGLTGVDMAPAADLFELGGRVQVLKHRNLFAPRARKLFELYQRYGSIEELPAAELRLLERQYFRQGVEETWRQTEVFFRRHDPGELRRAERRPRHKLALLLRWYLGLSSRWARAGEGERSIDYQVWCGPAMGAFNEWARGSFLAAPAERRVAQVAENLLAGAAATVRGRLLVMQGAALPPAALGVRPRRLPVPT